MRSPAVAIAWAFWSANRRGWLLLLAAMAACGLLLHILGDSLRDSESMQFAAYLPLVAALLLAMAFCNFTDRQRRDGIAGFPRHLFTLPVNTRLSVTCALLCSLISVIGLYIAWVTLVLKPLDAAFLVRWPATLLAAFVVFYQSIVWCFCGFRLTRMISLSMVATLLVFVGFMPTLVEVTSVWSSERNLSVMLVGIMCVAYGATIVVIDTQRRGGARGWSAWPALLDAITRVAPSRKAAITSADAALFWIEWRRAGLVLPAAVLLATALVLGPVLAITGRGREETLWAEMWLVILPVLFAFPIGLGFGKPAIWSLELALSPFITTRPITEGQLLAAKLKAAACSTLLTWGLLITVAPLCIYLYCDTKHWADIWGAWQSLYSPTTQWLLPLFLLAAAMLLTWGLLVAHLWLGFSGRAAVYYSVASGGLAAFVTAFFFFVWWLDHPRSHGDTFVRMLPWLPWALALVLTAKLWIAAWCSGPLRRHRLVSGRGIAVCLGVCFALAGLTVFAAYLFSPRIEWLRNVALLAALNAIPIFNIAVTPFTISWNRHR